MREQANRTASRWTAIPFVEIGLLCLVALALRLVDLGYPPFIDELNHVLAAQSLLEDGTLSIADGRPYTRSWLFTYLVAGFFALFGESLEVARLPAVIAGVALVGLMFVWLRTEVGRVGAWTAGLLLCFAPIAIYLSQWVRFYALHALVFWLGTLGVYRLVMRRDPMRRRWLIVAGSLLAYAIAYHLQITTIVGLAGVGLFVLAMEGSRLLRRIGSSRDRLLVVGALSAALLASGAVAVWLGAVDWIVLRATIVDTWALDRATNTRFFHYLFVQQYGFLWVLLPAAVLLGLTGRWQLTLLFGSILTVVIVVHSLVAWKAERYVFYALPAMFGLWGIAAQEVLPALRSRVASSAERILGWLPKVAMKIVVVAALVAAGAFATTGVEAYTTTRLVFLQGRPFSPEPGYAGERLRGHSDWEAASSRLAALSDSVEVVIAGPDLKALYYLGDLDFILYAGHLASTAESGRPPRRSPEFTEHSKVGRPAVSTPTAIELVMECYETGLIVVEDHLWGWRWGVPDETAEFIERRATPVSLDPALKIRAFRWGSNVVAVDPGLDAGNVAEWPTGDAPSCEELRRLRASDSAGTPLR